MATTLKTLTELRNDLASIQGLVIDNNPDLSYGQANNRFYTFLDELLVNLQAYVVEPAAYTGVAFDRNQFSSAFG